MQLVNGTSQARMAGTRYAPLRLYGARFALKLITGQAAQTLQTKEGRPDTPFRGFGGRA